VETTFIQPLAWDLDEISHALQPAARLRAPVLPPALARSWVAARWIGKGGSRAEGRSPTTDQVASPIRGCSAGGGTDRNRAGRQHPAMGRGPSSTPSSLQEPWRSARIAILLWIALRRLGDMFADASFPLIVAAAMTLEICAATHFCASNYANIIALPVLLGVGVAFKIYYIVAWPAGWDQFFCNRRSRAAVFFSALMTRGPRSEASGSPANPGMSSVGKLLALSLACTLAAAALFQARPHGTAHVGPS